MNSQSPLKRIREYCLQCVCGSPLEVKQCVITNCPLWDFRLGKNPFRAKRELSDEQKEAIASRLAESRKNRAKNP